MLIIVHDRNIQAVDEAAFNGEALRGFNVFKINAAKGGGQHFNSGDDLLGPARVKANIEGVHIRESLEQQAFAFHNRLCGKRADIAKAEHRRAVGDHSHEVALARVFIGCGGVGVDGEASLGHTRRIGKGEVLLG